MFGPYSHYDRPTWHRSYAIDPSALGPDREFLHWDPEPKVTWMQLVDWARKMGKLEIQEAYGPSRPVLHFSTASGKKEMLVAIDGRRLVKPVEAARIGTSAGVPYLHAEHLLYGLYRSYGGTLPRHKIRFSKMPGIYDAIY